MIDLLDDILFCSFAQDVPDALGTIEVDVAPAHLKTVCLEGH